MDKWLPDIVLGLMMIFIITRRPTPYFSYTWLVFILLLIYGWIKQRKSKQPLLSQIKDLKAIVFSMIIFYGMLILDSLFLKDQESLKESLQLASYSIPLFLTCFARSKCADDEGAKFGIAIGAVILCCIGLWEIHFHPGIRMQSTYDHPNHLSTIFTLLMPFTGYFALKGKKFWVRILMLGIIILQAVCLYHTDSRGGFMAIAIGVPIALIITALTTKQTVSFALKKTAAVIILLALTLGGGALYARHDSLNQYGKMGGERIQMLQSSMRMWNDHKLLGIGTARWQENYYGKYHPKNGHEQGLRMPHNMPVYFLSTSGMIGFAGYLIFSGVSLWTIISLGRKGDPILYAAMLIAFWAFFIHGFVDATIIRKPIARLYFALLGYYIAGMQMSYLNKKINKN